MLERFRHIAEEMRGLIEDSRSASPVIPTPSCLLAVSGGVDSMCLADLWLRCFGARSFAMAHCNFHLRGDESDGDEMLVRNWADEHGVRLHQVDFDTAGYASENGLSIEMAARELRYDWFGRLCEEHGYAAVAVAHHADDNAETMVLNMVRGAGLKGLTGMKPIAPLPVGQSFRQDGTGREIFLLRPLLTFSRKQIEGHVFAWKVPYREDSTNSSVEYRRNSIRHEVFPLFERMNPSYVRTLNREMTFLSDASSIVDEWCRSRIQDVMTSQGTAISVPALMAIPQWRYLLYHILEPYGFNGSVLEALEDLLLSDRTLSGKRFDSQTHCLLTGRDNLVIADSSDYAGLRDESEVLEVDGPGTYEFNGMRFRVEQIAWSSSMPLKQPAGVLVFDASRLAFPFVCRRWRQGDWMVPFGMRGRKKVSDLFADLKYGMQEKQRAVVLDAESSGLPDRRVAAVLGVRQDDSFKITESTAEAVRIEITN